MPDNSVLAVACKVNGVTGKFNPILKLTVGEAFQLTGNDALPILTLKPIVLTGAVSGTSDAGKTSVATTINTIYMRDQGVWLRNSTPVDNNHGMIYNLEIDGVEMRGFGGFNFKTGTGGATQVMRLNSSGIDLGFKNIKGVAPPSLSTDAVNQNYVQNAIASSQPSNLQYLTYGDETYPVKWTRSVTIQNTYNPAIKETGEYGYLNANGSTGKVTDSPVYDLKCNGRIRASEFNAWSSRNIKNIVAEGEIVGQEASKIIENMPIAKYSFKDPAVERPGEFFGVISEEMMKYLPNYVTTNELRFVPNIMCLGKMNNIDNINYSILLHQNLSEDIKIGERIWVLIEKYAMEMTLISIDENLIQVKADKEVFIKDKDLQVFVYGTERDCPTVSVKHFAELALCALQDCIKRINKLEGK